MQPTEARDIGDALDDRPVPAVWPRPTHVGNEKYLADFWIIEASDLDVALKLATEGSKACNRKLEAEGHWVFAGGLASPSSATVIDNRGEEAMFTDGPFLESKEYLAGFWIMEAPDLDVALKLAAEGSKACNRKVEVRPFL